jgi:hypothetical protein
MFSAVHPITDIAKILRYVRFVLDSEIYAPMKHAHSSLRSRLIPAAAKEREIDFSSWYKINSPILPIGRAL